MPWLKTGDAAATHPKVMALATVRGADERTLNEVYGFVVRCANQSAGHMTDYRVDLGTARMLGGPHASRLLRQAVDAGLLILHGKGRDRSWQIVQDNDLFHVRLKEEVEWDRQRKRDAANPELTVPVRVRDGDACRYCGNVVYWGDRRGGRGGTYDHREPGRPATPDTYVVCCRTCNSSRKAAEDADEKLPLLPAPTGPIYTRSTVKWLASHGVTVQAHEPPPADEPGGKRDPHRRVGTPRAARPGETSPDTAQSTRPGGHEPDTAPPTRGTAPGESPVKRDPSHWRDTARPNHNDVAGGTTPRDPGQPGRDTAQSTRPGGHEPDTAPPTRGTGPPWATQDTGPPGWATGSADYLQKPAETSRKEGFGPGRDGQGRAGTGAAPPEPACRTDPPCPHPSSPAATVTRRRARRSRRRKDPS